MCYASAGGICTTKGQKLPSIYDGDNAHKILLSVVLFAPVMSMSASTPAAYAPGVQQAKLYQLPISPVHHRICILQAKFYICMRFVARVGGHRCMNARMINQIVVYRQRCFYRPVSFSSSSSSPCDVPNLNSITAMVTRKAYLLYFTHNLNDEN